MASQEKLDGSCPRPAPLRQHHSNEVITYDSDDEMVRSNRSRTSFASTTRTTKKGHPIYSREDIREQYCINRKELCVFEDNAYQDQTRLFGCLSTSHLPDHSPCNKNASFLLSCVQKRKSSIDSVNKQLRQANDNANSSMTTSSKAVEDDEDSDGGFKRRPKPRTCYLAEQRYTWACAGQTPGQHGHPPQPIPGHQYPIDSRMCSQETLDSGHYVSYPQDAGYAYHYGGSQVQAYNLGQNRFGPRPQFHNFSSLGYAVNDNYTNSGHPRYQPNQPRPSNLRFDGSFRDPSLFSKGSHSVDELNGGCGARGGEDAWYARQASNQRIAKTPDLLQGEERTKHVSFDTHALVRSNTIGGGLEAEPQSPVAYPSGANYNDNGERNKSQERLIMGLQNVVSVTERSTSSATLTSAPTPGMYYYNSNATFYPPTPNYVPALRVMRTAVMKTQATQTATAPASTATTKSPTSSRTSIPAYLTLSPRASAVVNRREQRRHSSNYHYNRHPYNPTSGGQNVQPHNALILPDTGHSNGTLLSSSEQSSHTQVTTAIKSKHPLVLPNALAPGTSLDSDDEDDEVMQVQLKEPKQRKTHRTSAGFSSTLKSDPESRARVRQRIRHQPQTSARDVTGRPSSQPPPGDKKAKHKVPEQTVQELVHVPVLAAKSQSADALESFEVALEHEEQMDHEFRRHSIGEGLCVDLVDDLETVEGYDHPPSAEEPKISEQVINSTGSVIHVVTSSEETVQTVNVEPERPPSSASSESSKAVCSGLTDVDQQSTVGFASEIDELDQSSLQVSHEDSPTLVSDLSSHMPDVAESAYRSRNEAAIAHAKRAAAQAAASAQAAQQLTNVTRRPLVIESGSSAAQRKLLREATFDMGQTIGPEALNSPESENSNSHLTELVSSASSGQKEDDDLKGSGSSVYVTATEHTPRGTDGKGTCSFETASSAAASLFSSPSSSGKRKSSTSSTGVDGEGALSPDFVSNDTKPSKVSLLSPNRPHGSLSTSPVGRHTGPGGFGVGRIFHDDGQRSESSEDSSTRRERITSSPGSESAASKNFDFDFDSEGMGDTTPLYEIYSSDPSTAFEPTTVVEKIPDLISISREVSKIVSSAVTTATAIIEKERSLQEDQVTRNRRDVAPRELQSNSEDEAAGGGTADPIEKKALFRTSSSASGSKQPVKQTASGASDNVSEELAEISSKLDNSDKETAMGASQLDQEQEVLADFEKGSGTAFMSPEKMDEFLMAASSSAFCRRTLSGELSTVSEVSEEMSNHKSTDDASISSATSSSSHSSSKEKESSSKSKKIDDQSSTGGGHRADTYEITGSSKECGSEGITQGTQELTNEPKTDNSAEREMESGHSSPSIGEESTSGSFCIDGQGHESDGAVASIGSDESKRESSTVEKTSATTATEDSHQAKDNEESQESPGSGFRQIKEDTRTSEKELSPPKANIVAANAVAAEYESSQATERDVARSEFSLEQQSSQDFDEESLSLGGPSGQSISHLPPSASLSNDQISADVESMSGAAVAAPGAVFKPKIMPKPIFRAPSSSNSSAAAQPPPPPPPPLPSIGLPLRLQPAVQQTTTLPSQVVTTVNVQNVQPLIHSLPLNGNNTRRIQQLVPQQNIQEQSSSESSLQAKREAMQRRTKSLKETTIETAHISELDQNKNLPHVPHKCTSHRYTCSHCGQDSGQKSSSSCASGHHEPLLSNAIPTLTTNFPLKARPPMVGPYKRSATIDDIYSDSSAQPDDAEEDGGHYVDSYHHETWLYIGQREELAVWTQKLISPMIEGHDNAGLKRSESLESTVSEKSFRKQFEAVTHRMIHRKASIEMYKRLLNKSLVVEKSVVITRCNGEFGFRIHGSRPVVVSAIEKGTPAESCGLEVGDIIVRLNGVEVIDASHSEIVRLAHSGTETLRIELVRTRNTVEASLSSASNELDLKKATSKDTLLSGYLQRRTQSKATAAGQSGPSHIWRRRWYLLKTDYCLYWYKDCKDVDPIGALHLHNCCASLDLALARESSYPLKVVKDGQVVQAMAGIDTETALRWVTALNDASNRLSQSDPYLEAALRYSKCSPVQISEGDVYGYLAKFCQKRKIWKQRYFVLKDACLFLYSDVTSSAALGAIYLQGYKVQSCSMASKKNTFELVPPQTKFKHFWLMAENEIDKKRWLAGLEYSIDRWLRASSSSADAKDSTKGHKEKVVKESSIK